MIKRIIIIGASSGIGLHSAKLFAGMGWRVGVAARDTRQLIALKNQYRDKIEYERIDITTDECPELIIKLIEKLGGLDVMFLSAGIGWANPMLNLQKDLDTAATNVAGFMRVVDTAYHYFRDNKISGQIAAVTSVAGTKGLGISASYSATKRFGSTYLEAIGQLASIDRVKLYVTDIRPGFVRTPLLDSEKSYPMLMTLDHAAPLIVNAIVKRKRVAVIDWKWAFLVKLWNLIPGCLWRKMKIKL